MIAAAAIMIFGFSISTNAQIKTGGYKKVSVDDAGVKAAAQFAAKQQGENADITVEVIEIVDAERQVVAGSNYRMCLKVSSYSEDEDESTYFVKTIVYVDLKGNKKLTSWTVSDCGEQ